MKTYVIYQEVPHPNGHKNKYYVTQDGDKSLDVKDARRYNVKTWLEFIITVLQLVIKVFGTNLKYKQI